MDSFLGKLGLYQLFGVLFSGSIVIAAVIYLDLFPYPADENMNDAIEAILFLVISYLLGIVVQEAGSFIDRKLLKKKFMDNLRFHFLNSDVFRNPLELNDFRKIGNAILHKNGNNIEFTEVEESYVFFFCKDYLEVNGKDSKAEGLNSLYAMSRGLMVAFPLIAIWYLGANLLSSNPFVLAFLVTLSFLFYKRSRKYAELRVRAIMRHYKMDKTEKIAP